MKISVVTALYRSAPYVEEFCRRTLAAFERLGVNDYEIILVNDGSPDDSALIARRMVDAHRGITLIDLSRNFGQHKAMMAGVAHASGDLVYILDSDLEEEPEWLIPFHAELVARQCDVVYGYNTNLKGGFIYSVCRRIFYKTLNGLASAQFPEYVCAARLMTRRYVDALLQFREREMFMAGVWHMTGFEQLPVKVHKHDSSPTTYSVRGLVAAFVNAITAFSVRPLIAISIAGIILSLIAFIYLAAIVYQKLAHGIAVEGWASVMGAVLLIGGVTLFFNGIMAIYIAKIFIEVKQRPRSIVREIYPNGPSDRHAAHRDRPG